MDFSLFAPAPLTLFYEVGRVKFINLKKKQGTDGKERPLRNRWVGGESGFRQLVCNGVRDGTLLLF